MPLYEYACRACGHPLEARQKISDPPLSTCPKCKAEALERLVSKSSFALKGSGWYADGYGAGSGSSASSGTESKSETKSEAKPDSKAEPKAESKPEPKPEPKAKPES